MRGLYHRHRGESLVICISWLAPWGGWNSIGLPRSPFGISHPSGLPRSQPRPPQLPLSSYLCFAREEQICDPSCNGQTAKIGRKSQPAQRHIPGRILTSKRGAASTPPELHVHWALPSRARRDENTRAQMFGRASGSLFRGPGVALTTTITTTLSSVGGSFSSFFPLSVHVSNRPPVMTLRHS